MKKSKSYCCIANPLLIISLVLLSGCINNSQNVVNVPEWLRTYIPIHSIGGGSDNFWIDNPKDGKIIHPQWVNDSLESNCVVFVVHRHTCAYCDPQAKRVIKISEKYKEYINFYDLDIDLGEDLMMKGYDSLVYDPDGPPHYIALTGIITLIKEDGNLKYVWHAWEGDMTESELEDWIKDAIYYHYKTRGKI